MVLDYVRSHAPTGRAEIARSCGLSVQAVYNITDVLEQDGFLSVVGKATGKRGKPVMQYRFNTDGAFAVGLELRPDALICAVLNLKGETIFTSRDPIKNATPERAIPAAKVMIEAAIKNAGRQWGHLLGVGVVMPGPFGESGLSGVGEASLPGWEGADTRTRFEAALGCKVIVENDATAAAISERVAGVARQIDNFCFVYFGTGLGLGVIADGHALRGGFGNFGEIGHIITQANGTLCACGNRGCLETYASRMSAKNHLESQGVVLSEAADLAALLTNNNPVLAQWIERAAQHLSQAVGILENIFDPETVILGGAMPDAVIDALIARLTLPAGSVANRAARSTPRVQRGLSGRNTAAIGGAAMIIHQSTTPALALFNER